MIWRYKPWWCQPWSIILTGLLVTVSSWFLIHNWIITAIVSVLIMSWWIYFLIIYPRMMAEFLANQGQTTIDQE